MKYILWTILSGLTAFWAWARHKETIVKIGENLRDHANAIISSMDNIEAWAIRKDEIKHREGVTINVSDGMKGVDLVPKKKAFNLVEKKAIWVAYRRLLRNTIVSNVQPKQISSNSSFGNMSDY